MSELACEVCWEKTCRSVCGQDFEQAKLKIQSLESALDQAEKALEAILTENYTAIGSDDYFEGLDYACRMIRPKIKEVISKIRSAREKR